MPSVSNNTSCTAIFDLETRTWSKLAKDIRTSPYEGTFDTWHGEGDGTKLIYFGGLTNENMTKDEGKWKRFQRVRGHFAYEVRKRDDSIWLFDGVDFGWRELPVKLPPYSLNALKLMTLHPDFCKE